MRRLGTPLQIVERAETARVVEADDGAVVQGQDDVIVRLGRGVGMAGGDAPRHAQMQQQEPGLVELYQDVLAAARERPDPRPVETRGEHRRKRPAQIRPAQFGTHDAAARHASGKAAPDGFDFG